MGNLRGTFVLSHSMWLINSNIPGMRVAVAASYWMGVFSVCVKNEGGKHVFAQDELPTGSLRHLKPHLRPDAISQLMTVAR